MKRPIPSHIAGQLREQPPEERRKLEEVWRLAGDKRPGTEDVESSGGTKEQAREHILKRIRDLGSGDPKPSHIPHDTESWLASRPEEERNSLLEVWELAGRKRSVRKEEIELADARKKNVFNAVRERAGTAKPRKPAGTIYRFSQKRALLTAAAAVLTIIFMSLAIWQLGGSDEIYFAAPGETLTVNLADGSVAELNSGSELRIHQRFGSANRDVQLSGEAFFEVARSDIQFRVSTTNAVVKVLGTAFNVRSWPEQDSEQTVVAVTSGLVEVINPIRDEQPRRIESGQVSRVLGIGELPELLEEARLGDAIAWRNRNLAFNGIRLTDALAELRRRFNVHITLESGINRSMAITAFYQQPESAKQVLTDIASLSGLELVETEEGFVLKKPAPTPREGTE